ncbi:MAG TPA: adenylate/guanylate cyclase domain-containing protein, partial [Variovorax sp.]|nr:adenylate/guanylate cyclase domain-containing protein [Variovorax sp.]
MTTTCAGCGAEVLPSSSFCQRCGRRLDNPRPPDPEPSADRRQVTVLFADLTGFTALSEELDPETVRSFQNALFETMAQAIAQGDGFVEKFVGDAVMAVFGAPRAHEDDPLRALEAAQDMMQRVERLSRQWGPRLGRGVTLHIGVHTGPVVAGSLGSGAGGAYAVTGDTVNTASRLLSAAQPGTVLVSDATWSLVRHRFDFEPATELALRGKAQPMRVHVLRGARTDAVSARGLAELGLAAPLVGRDDAIERLLAAFDRMQGGEAQLVSVVGEAGAGKSRLLAELFARLEAQGRLASTGVRRTACSSHGEPTYGTFGALFREVYQVRADDSLEVARRKLHDGLQALGADAAEVEAVARVVGHLLGIEEARPQDIEPEQLQRQITLAARAMLERRLARQPVVIVIDDMQWADAASADLLREVIDQLADRPLMLLAAQRPDARALRPLRAAHATIALEPLDDRQAGALVGHLLGGADG